ncbi:MAG: YgeY family selenium metabolism-linked hydrolase [Theionarchaea archaeon]|nr:YgeY family selenium metabolism-linked hydrolase [Theionarchaea archaeon]
MEEKEVVKITQHLIQTPSLSGQEKDAAFLIRDLLSEIGTDSVHIDSYGNIITEVKGGGDSTVMLEGHMDHVPPGNETLWDHPPYAAHQTGDKIFGRGAVDMKGALASMISALGHISRKERSISVMGAFVVHEETVEGAAIQRIIEEGRIKPDLVILGEPTHLNSALGHRGRCLLKVILEGRTAHASMPDLGINSIESGAYFIQALHQSPSLLPSHPILGKASITPISMECSPKGLPQLPDTSELIFDRRLILNERESDLLQWVQGIIDALITENRVQAGTVSIQEEELRCWTGKSLTVRDFFPAWITDESSREVSIIKKALSNLDSRCIIWEFSTDGVYTKSRAGIPTVGFGPGDWRLAHQPNEHVAVSELHQATQGYVDIIDHLEDSL